MNGDKYQQKTEEKLVHSMPDKLNGVLDLKGYRTKYYV